MNKIILFLLLLQTLGGFSQNKKSNISLDTLNTKRMIFWTNIYKNSVKQSTSGVLKALNNNPKALKKYKWAKVLMPIAPIFMIGGVALMTNGLMGVDRSTYIDGIKYDYTERSLKKTLLGLFISATGICLMESSNELIQHAVDLHNNKLLSKKQKISFGIGATPEGNIGLLVKF